MKSKKQSVNFDLPLSDSVRGKSTVDGLIVEVVIVQTTRNSSSSPSRRLGASCGLKFWGLARATPRVRRPEAARGPLISIIKSRVPAGLRGLRMSLAWYYLSGMMGLRLAEAGLRAASVGLRASLAWHYLHETAVSWIRLRLAATVPSKPWLETRGEYAGRLRRVVDDINMNLDVEGLCKGLLKRLDLAIEAEGGRIPK